MRILRAIPELAELGRSVVLSVGVFDGVHLGHRRVLEEALRHARQIGGLAVALTFDPHPVRVLRPENAPRLLTSTQHKARLIDDAGIHHMLLVNFDRQFAEMPAELFVRKLGDTGVVRRICVGEEWVFGRGRTGSVQLLRELGDEMGFAVSGVPPVVVDGEVVSSTRIREAVERGDLAAARSLLGRDYTVLGTVERGDELGRKLGFPTANLRAHNEQFPPNGVYAVKVFVRSEEFDGVANIGVRPTVTGATGERKLEVHLFDFEGDLYDQDLDVDFIAFLRPERKFEGLDALRMQIAADVGAAKAVLA